MTHQKELMAEKSTKRNQNFLENRVKKKKFGTLSWKNEIKNVLK